MAADLDDIASQVSWRTSKRPIAEIEERFEAIGHEETRLLSGLDRGDHFLAWRTANGLLKWWEIARENSGESETLAQDLVNHAISYLERHRTVTFSCIRRAIAARGQANAQPLRRSGEGKRITILCPATETTLPSVAVVAERLGAKVEVVRIQVKERAHPSWLGSSAWYPTQGNVDLSPSSLQLASPPPALDWSNYLSFSPQWNGDVLLAGMPPIPAEIVALSRHRFLNIHNGLVPVIRGLDSPAWSLLAGVPLQSSLHAIDAEIDKGSLLLTVTVGLDAGGLPSKRTYAEARADLLSRYWAGEVQDIKPLSAGESKLSRWNFHAMHQRLRVLLGEFIEESMAFKDETYAV